jgi:hypothetical protein
MGCESCYCNMFMQERKGCLYMFQEAHERLKSVCPCLDCIVQIMCKDRYNVCVSFHNFLNDSFVTITPEAKAFNCRAK